jgi:hypothetical protein
MSEPGIGPRQGGTIDSARLIEPVACWSREQSADVCWGPTEDFGSRRRIFDRDLEVPAGYAVLSGPTAAA